MKLVRIVTLAMLSLSIGVAQRAFGAGSGTVSKVVIDAGHGGTQPGAVNGKVMEKDITLAIALKLGALIEENYPDVQVIYTRKKDVAVDLNERGNIANKAGADLFISIHTNSSKVGAPSGSETYVMGLDKTGKNLDVAMRENDVIVYEKDYSSKYQGYEPGAPESFIIFNLMQYAYLVQSLSLASLIEQQYRGMRIVPSRGVKQGPFLVLWTPAMPSLLTEVGFINNPSDLKVINSSAGQENIARAIFNAFSAYKTRIDGKGKLIVLGAKDYVTAPVAAPSPSVAQDVATAPPTDYQDVTVVATSPSPTIIPPTDEVPVESVQPAPAPAPVVVPPPAPTPVVAAKPAPAHAPSTVAPGKGQAVVYAVQICASVRRISKQDALLKLFASEVYEYKEDNYYRYYVGRYDTYAEAQRRQVEVRRTIKDAFVVALRGGRKIPLAEAFKLTKK